MQNATTKLYHHHLTPKLKWKSFPLKPFSQAPFFHQAAPAILPLPQGCSSIFKVQRQEVWWPECVPGVRTSRTDFSKDPQRELFSLSHHSVIEKLVVYVTRWIFNLSRNVQVSDVGCQSSRSACGCPAQRFDPMFLLSFLLPCICQTDLWKTNNGESGRSGSTFCLQKPLVLEKSLCLADGHCMNRSVM